MTNWQPHFLRGGPSSTDGGLGTSSDTPLLCTQHCSVFSLSIIGAYSKPHQMRVVKFLFVEQPAPPRAKSPSALQQRAIGVQHQAIHRIIGRVQLLGVVSRESIRIFHGSTSHRFMREHSVRTWNKQPNQQLLTVCGQPPLPSEVSDVAYLLRCAKL